MFGENKLKEADSNKEIIKWIDNILIENVKLVGIIKQNKSYGKAKIQSKVIKY